MTAVLRAQGISSIVLTAQEDVPYEKVIELTDAARAAGAGDVRFAPPIPVKH